MLIGVPVLEETYCECPPHIYGALVREGKRAIINGTRGRLLPPAFFDLV